MCSTQFIFILLSFYYFLSILRKKILVSWWLGLGAIDAPEHRIQNTYQWAIMAIFYHSIMLTTKLIHWTALCQLKILLCVKVPISQHFHGSCWYYRGSMRFWPSKHTFFFGLGLWSAGLGQRRCLSFCLFLSCVYENSYASTAV